MMTKLKTISFCKPILLLAFVFLLLSPSSSEATEPCLSFQGIPQVIPVSELNNVITAKIVLSNADDVYGISFSILYDDSIIEMLDNDTAREGINLKANSSMNMVYQNEISLLPDTLSTIRFNAITITTPVPSGPVEIAELKLKFRKQGSAFLVFQDSEFQPDKVRAICCGQNEPVVVKPRLINAYFNVGDRDNYPPQISVLPPEPKRINPSGAQENRNTVVKYHLDENAFMRIWITNEMGQQIGGYRYVNKADVQQNPFGQYVWDGKNNGLVQPDEKYYIKMQARDDSQNWGPVISSEAVEIDSKPPPIQVVEKENMAFSPNADGIKDLMAVTFKSEKGASTNVAVYKEGDNPSLATPIKTLLSRVLGDEPIRISWDGWNDNNNVVNEGRYFILIKVEDETGNVAAKGVGTIFVDLTPPILSSPEPLFVCGETRPELTVHSYDPGTSSGIDTKTATIKIDDGKPERIQNYSASRFRYAPTNSLSYGPHIITTKIQDNAGNSRVIEWALNIGSPPDINLTSVYPNPFNPITMGSTKFYFETAGRTSISGRIYNNANVIASLSGINIEPGQHITVSWDGKWDSPDGRVHDGIYNYSFNFSDTSCQQKVFATGTVTVDTTAPVVSVMSVVPAMPVVAVPGGTVDVTVSAADNYDTTPDVAARVVSAQGAVVKTLGVNAISGGYALTWDGADANRQPAADGQYFIEITATDDAQNAGAARVAVSIDGSGPWISAINPAQGADTGTFSPIVTVRVRDAFGGAGVDADSITIAIDGEPPQVLAWSPDLWIAELPVSLNPASGNSHTALATAADKLGNVSSLEWQFYIDTKLPALAEFVSPAVGAALIGAVKVVVRVADNAGGIGIARTELSVDDAPAQSQDGAGPVTQFNTDTVALSDGPHTLKVKTYDAVGNYLESALSVTTDNSPPKIDSVVSTNEGTFSPNGNSEIKTVTLTPDIHELSAYEWSLEIGTGDKSAGTWASVFFATQSVATASAPVGIVWNGRDANQQIVTDGIYPFHITATDTVGLVSLPYQGQLTADSAPPSTALITPDPANPDTWLQSGDIPVSADVTDALPGTVAAVEAVLTPAGTTQEQRLPLSFNDVTGKWEFTWPTTAVDDGVYALLIEAHDAAGNKTRTDAIELAVANAPASITNVTDAPDPFAPMSPPGNSPNTTTDFAFKVTTSVPVRVDWRLDAGSNAGGAWTALKTFTGSIPLQTGVRKHNVGPVTWDGRDDGNAVLSDGVYKYRIIAETFNASGDLIASAEYTAGVITIDSTPPVIDSVAATPDFFNPDGNGITDTTTLTASVAETSAVTAQMEILCATGNSVCQTAFGGGVLKMFEAPFAAGLQPSFPWDGKVDSGGTAVLVPDGDYTVRWRMTDAAGNTSSIAEGEVTKDNPPVIAVQPEEAAFSPNGDGSKELMSLEWSADQDGYFTFKVYDANSQFVETIAENTSYLGQAGATATVTWDGKDASGEAYPEGTYRIEITGRDAHSRVENPCKPVNGAALLDVTAPVVSPFYPFEHEFTWQRPKIKINVTDNLSGFGPDAAAAVDMISFGVSGFGGGLPVSVANNTPLSLRAWTRPDMELTDGPHNLTAAATDRAGNTGTLEQVRFVSIPPFADDFTGTGALDTANWQIVPIRGGSGSATINNGILTVSHTNNRPDDGIPPLDIYGISIVGKGVYDVSRQEVVVELNQFNESGTGDLHGAGVAVTEVIEGRFPKKLYLVKSGDDVFAFYEDDLGDDAAWLAQTQVAGPADLKIVYEEGNASFYVNGGLLRTVNVSLTNAMVGMVAMSGYQTGSGSSASAQAQSLWTDLAGPRVTSVEIANSEDVNSTNIILNEQHYTLTANGTPWQRNVQGRVYNTLRVGQVGNVDVALDKLTIGAPAPLTETFEGSGIYVSQQIPADTYTDAQGYEAAYLVPYAANQWFDVLPINKTDYMTNAQDYLKLVTNAVTAVSLVNADNPAGYAYIIPGEHYRIEAQTRSGDWRLNAYLLNLQTLQSGGTFSDAVIAGPVAMTKNGETSYTAESALTSATDASGHVASNIVARVVYGPAAGESKPSANSLAVGEPVIRWTEISNAERSGASDIVVGETVTVTARAKTGETVSAYLYNPGNPVFGQSLVLGPFSLTETSPGSGTYRGETVLLRGFDKSGMDMSRVRAVVTAAGHTPPPIVFSFNELQTLAGDTLPPAPPQDAAVISGTQQIPQSGATVTTAFTWTAPAANQDSSELLDLSGYNIYRAREIPGTGGMSVASGSPAPSIIRNTDGTYGMSAAFYDYNGVTYNNTQASQGASAGWLTPGARDLTALPLSNSNLVQPNKEVFAYTVRLSLTGVLYSPGMYYGTVYSQSSRESVEQWISNLIELGVAASGGVDAHTVAFSVNPDGTFTAASTLNALNHFDYQKINGSPVAGNTYTDTYAFDGDLYGYAATAVDGSGNESLPSIIASTPPPSLPVASARIANAPGALSTGYIQPGENLLIEAVIEDIFLSSLTARLVDLDALEQGTPLEQAFIGGSLTLHRDTSDLTLYRALPVLPTLIDAGGRTASELAAVIDVRGAENVTADGVLKGGVAPVRSVEIVNATRPDKGNIREGETVRVTAQGNSGLNLSAALMNPEGTETGNGTTLAQPAVSLTENPSGSGFYEGEAVIATSADAQGDTAARVIALIRDAQDRVTPPVPSPQSLALLPPLDLAGNIALQPEWLMPGWELNALFDITNNGQERIQEATVRAAILTPDGEEVYTAEADISLLPGQTITGQQLAFGSVTLTPGTYDAVLVAEIDGSVLPVATTTLTMVGDIITGTLVTDKSVYFSGEDVVVNYTIENVSGRTLPSLETALRLKDDTDAIVQTATGSILTNLAPGETRTGSITITLPAGTATQKHYHLELAGIIGDQEDMAADGFITAIPETIIITGAPFPDHVIRYQEPFFIYKLTNQTRETIIQGIVTGEVHALDYQEGDTPLATFTSAVQNLASRQTKNLSGTFSPVGGDAGEYRVVIYFQRDAASPRVKVFETPIWVELCGP